MSRPPKSRSVKLYINDKVFFAIETGFLPNTIVHSSNLALICFQSFIFTRSSCDRFLVTNHIFYISVISGAGLFLAKKNMYVIVT